MWLECIGVVSRCCCKEVYRFPHNTYPYSTCISSFLQQHPYLIVFSFLFMLCLCNICSKRCSKNIRDGSKIEITRTWSGGIIILTNMSTMSPETSTCEAPVTFYRSCELTLCTIMAS